MIDMTGPSTSLPAASAGDGKVMRWEKNERMGGMVPVWTTEKAHAAKNRAGEQLSRAAGLEPPESFETAFTQAGAAPAGDRTDEAFGFGDLVDMVNPLQHLPVIGYLYRELTGDDIRPVSKIVGGGLYGGFAGAAAGLVDTAIAYETGKGVTENIVAFVTEGETPSYRSAAPERRLDEALRLLGDAPDDLPASILGFSTPSGSEAAYRVVSAAHGRTAGTVVDRSHKTVSPPVARIAPSLIPALQDWKALNS